MNPLLLEISAGILAAGILGLVAGWMIRNATIKSLLERRQARELQRQAEAALHLQTEIDDLLARISAGEAERDDLIRANQSLEEALIQIEHDAMRRRGVATEQRLRAYTAALPAAGGRPTGTDWSSLSARQTPEPDADDTDRGEFTAIDETVLLADDTVVLTDETVLLARAEDDVTLALDYAGNGTDRQSDLLHELSDPASHLRGFVKRDTPAVPVGGLPATGNQ